MNILIKDERGQTVDTCDIDETFHKFIIEMTHHVGYEQRILSTELLNILGLTSTSNNQRKIRKWQEILVLKYAIPCIAESAKNGGYWIANTIEEIEKGTEHHQSRANAEQTHANALHNIANNLSYSLTKLYSITT